MSEITIKNNGRKFACSPLKAEWNGGKGVYLLSSGEDGFYGQAETTGSGDRIVFIPPPVKENAEVKLRVEKPENAPESVKLVDKKDECVVDIFINEEFFTAYNYSDKLVRPFLYPLIGPDGRQMLRTPASEGNPEKIDHEHHRGIWVSHGDTNGTDNWSEVPGHGYTVHEKFIEMVSGPVFGKLHARSRWTSNAGKKILDEERIITVYNMPEDRRMIDHNIILRASEGEVVFKDTKESGLLSIRVNPSMEGSRGGTLINAYGGRGEAECWGKRAEWCDYCGEVEGTTCGFSIFDHQQNFRHPTWWHIRNYGLFTANFFGLSDFTGNKKQTGTYILPAYQEMHLNYRIYVHKGDAVQSRVAERYLNFIYPPQVSSAP